MYRTFSPSPNPRSLSSNIFQVVTEWFGNLIGLDVQATALFFAFTIDQIGKVVNAIKAVDVEVVMRCTHRQNVWRCCGWLMMVLPERSHVQEPRN